MSTSEPKQEKRWQASKNPELEDLYLKLEKIIDVFLLEREYKTVEAIERGRMAAEGNVGLMTDLTKEYGEKLWQLLAPPK
jgi:hypothetical protein